jgi:hypothetical protein
MKARRVKKSCRTVGWFLAPLVLCLFPLALAADSRIIMEARVNGQPVKLGFDTGAERTFLLQSTARRLGRDVTGPDPGAKAGPGRILAGMSEECEFSVSHTTMRTRLSIYDAPEGVSYDMDGMLAWYPLRDSVFLISGGTQSVTTLSDLPSDLASWTKWTIGPHKVLTIQVSGPGGEPWMILFDTGSFSGVELNCVTFSVRHPPCRDGHPL